MAQHLEKSPENSSEAETWFWWNSNLMCHWLGALLTPPFECFCAKNMKVTGIPYSSETWIQYLVQPTQCINQLSSWYGTTFRKKSRKLFRGRDLILMKLKPHVSLAGSSTNSPFWVFLSTRGQKIAQAWQKSIGVKTLTIWVCVSNLRPLYNL